MNEENDDKAEYQLKTKFYIDTDGYSDRDRELFVCGFEFCMVVDLEKSGARIERPIHRENTSRIRMHLGKIGRKFSIDDSDEYDASGTWAWLVVEEK